MTTAGPANPLAWIPSVHDLVEDPPEAVRGLAAGERLERVALAAALEDVRRQIRDDPAAFDGRERVEERAERAWESRVRALLRPALGPVVNATGVVVHTNLGRVPLAGAATDAARTAGGRYVALEYDLEAGERGSRYDHAADLLTAATGAEAAIAVNNNAAALLLAVDTLAGDRDVVVSRGELVEIGGGFRIHEILGRGRARLVEVGATNKTHPGDYEAALDEGRPGAILKVHRSNFAIEGFVAEVALADLCRLGESRGAPVIFDQGTGILSPEPWAEGEPGVADALADGATIVCASGDKLLGGPQAGLLFGSAEAIAAVRRNPLLRAMRVDKQTLAALEATLRLHLTDPDGIPVRRMMAASSEALEKRARGIVETLSPPARGRCEVAPHDGRAGGGTLPGVALPGWAVRIPPGDGSASALAARLRAGDPPIVARVSEDAVWLDVRTLLPGEDAVVAARLDELFENP